MEFGSPWQFSSDAAKTSPSSRSHFQKTVHLRDWWLTKPQPDDGRETLGVAGLTCTSQQNRAERGFSSAPILKVYDFFELETVDGVCVILQGYINKDRTLESGFPSEVFDHFVIGFPIYWEEFRTSWPKRVSAAQANEDGKDSIEGHDNFHDSSKEFADDPSLKTSSDNNDVRNNPSSKNFKISSRRVTRSMTKMDNSKNHSARGSLLHDIINLDKATDVDPDNLGSSYIPRKDTTDTLSNDKAVNAVDCDGVKCESRKNISTSEGNLDEQNLKNISLNLSFVCENRSNEASPCSNDMVSRIKSKRKHNDQYAVDATEDLRIKSASQVGTSNLRKNNGADVISESLIGTRNDSEAKHFEAECSDPLDPLSTTSVDVGCLVNGSTENLNVASRIIDLNDNTVISRTNMKACRKKKKDIAGAKQGILFKESSVTRSKSKRKLESGSSSCELTKSQCITTPKSVKSTSRLGLRCPTRTPVVKARGCKFNNNIIVSGSKDTHGSANILSPESFSGKKSRSGRVLLPTLEFWRNQTAVYDADRQVTGVLEGTESSRDISKKSKKFKKKARKACKP